MYHTCAQRDAFFVVEHLEEYLARDIVRIVTSEHKGITVKQVVQIHFQKVVLNDMLLHLRIVCTQVGHRLKVDFHHVNRTFFGYEKLSEDTHTWPYLKDGQRGTLVDSICYGFRYGKVFQKVLSQKFLGLYLFHSVYNLYRRPYFV